MCWFEPVRTFTRKQSMASISLAMAAKVFFDGFGGPVSNRKLQALQVFQDMYWLVPVRTSSCEQILCAGVAFGGGEASALLFAFA